MVYCGQTLYNLGARKVVVFAVGPLGCIPSQLATSNTQGKCLDTVNSYCRGFNTALRPLLTQMNSALPGANFCYGDVYRIVSQFVANPTQYGKLTAPSFLMHIEFLAISNPF